MIRMFYSKEHNDKETITAPSQTVPDQALTVREILMRFTRGQMELPPVETGDDDDIDDYSSNEFEDLVDAQEAYVRGQEQMDAIRLQSRLSNSPSNDNQNQSISDTLDTKDME